MSKIFFPNDVIRHIFRQIQYITNGFSKDNIVSIASNGGAKQAITTILEKYDTLIYNGFSKDNIVSIASNGGAKQAITTILDKYNTLIYNGFSKDNIVLIIIGERNNGTTTSIATNNNNNKNEICFTILNMEFAEIWKF